MMFSRKKLVIKSIIILALVMVLLTGCNSDGTKPTAVPTLQTTENETNSAVAAPTTPLNTEATGILAIDQPETQVSTENDKATLQLTNLQRNSVSMLNYLAKLTQEINASRNSRLYLESAYSGMLNNTHPNAVDETTQDHLIFLLDTMENFRMVAVKRNRLQYIYEQNRAQAMRDAVPNPLALLSAVSSFDWKRIAASVVYMAVDSYTSYKTGTAQADMQFIQDGWELDDEESEVLHNINTETFRYLNDTVRKHSLPGDFALNNDAITAFVDWKNNSNVAQKIRFLESNQKKYEAFGDYWIVLAESYYSRGEYVKCLEAIVTYQDLNIQIFRDDREYAKVLPLAIIAAREVYDDKAYIHSAEKFAQEILDNSDDKYEWSLCYFAAQTYVDLYAKTGNITYLKNAYEISLDNVNYLVVEQKSLNRDYLADVQEQVAPLDASAAEKKEIASYNKQIKEDRKLALPPVYEPLLLNCELYFSLADTLDISKAEKANMDEILHENSEALFLISTLDAQYRFDSPKSLPNQPDIDINFNGKEITIPAKYVTRNASIVVTVTELDSDEPKTFDDWKIAKVDRPDKNKLDSFMATFKSDALEKYSYAPNATVSINITSTQGSSAEAILFEYNVVNTKTDFWANVAFWNSNIGFQRVK